MGALFMNCTGLESVSLPEGLSEISAQGFYGCTALGSLTIPNSVTNIGQFAFFNCTNLNTLTIPAGVSSIGDYAFANCFGLSDIEVDPANASFSSEGGVLFNRNKSLLRTFPINRAGNYFVPNGVQAIHDYAFSDCVGLTSVTLPNGVTTIGRGAFLRCANLTNVTLPNTLLGVDRYTFHSCSNLSEIRIPESVTSIGTEAFIYSGITNLRIPGSVREIEEGAVRDCPKLTNVTVAAGVTVIDGFWNCPELKTIEFYGDRPVLEPDTIGWGSPELSIYYLPGTSGWSTSFGGRTTVLWLPRLSREGTRAGSPGSDFGFEIDWAVGKRVVVEARGDFGIGEWETVGTVTVPESGLVEFRETEMVDRGGRFFRLRGE